jgi:hypothetical protein
VSLHRWLQNLFDSLNIGSSQRRHSHARRNVRRRAPAARRCAVEALESRLALATLTVSDATLIEGDAGTTNALVTVKLSGTSNPNVTVNYKTANGTALAGSDYQAASGTLTFQKGQTSKSIVIPVIGDKLAEPNETFFVNLLNAKHATIADGQGVVTITDDDPTVSISDVSQAEGNLGSTLFNFSVTLSAASTKMVTVNYATADGTASAGSDYTTAIGSLTFAPGQTNKTVSVTVSGDRVGEPDEFFFVNLSGPTNAVLADNQAFATIVDDEPRMSVSIASATEGNAGTTAMVFHVTLSAACDVPVTVDYDTADDTAAADSDYQAAAGTLTFAPGQTDQTITVLVNGDVDKELDEYLLVNLANATGAYVEVSQGWGTILADDPLPLYVWIDSTSGYEGDGFMAFTVWLSQPSDEVVTVDFSTFDDSAMAWYDYSPASGTLTFAPGETSKTIWVEIIDDSQPEDWESFYVALSGISSNAVIQQAWATGTIVDNEYYDWWW